MKVNGVRYGFSMVGEENTRENFRGGWCGLVCISDTGLNSYTQSLSDKSERFYTITITMIIFSNSSSNSPTQELHRILISPSLNYLTDQYIIT